MKVELLKMMRESCDGKKREWRFLRGYSFNIEKVVLEVKIYLKLLSLRKIENKKRSKM